MIRFRLDHAEQEGLAFACSPLLETVLSLHVLAEPRHHALQHGWVRAMRCLSETLRRELVSLSFLYRWTLPNCILPSPTGGDDDFETELGRLRALRGDVAAFELLRPLYDHGGAARRARRRVLADPDVRSVALRQAGRLGPRTREAAAQLFDDPLALLDRFASLLAEYWREAFAAEWSRIEPMLADAIAGAGREIASNGAYRFLLALAPQLRVDPDREQFGLDVPHEHEITLGADNRLLLVPSVFVWPHVRVNCDPPWPLTLVYRAPHLVDSLRPPKPADVVQTFRALGDPTRLHILTLIAQRPRSTQELAPLISLTEAGTSRHLKLLAAAGILTTRREGYYVIYALAPGAFEGLEAELRTLVLPHADGASAEGHAPEL